MTFSYRTTGTCSRAISITVEDNILTDVKFMGGCDGNLKGISALVKGMNIDEAIEKLSGIKCGFKQTSCPDQLARALAQYKEQG
ncbi:MAG: TIGR03905 family TSCPD domain-containing protein [Clostridia bacterium]|nr:TIGR03905 family TSCPD domain-containing protein [Clostridia bacterium]